METIDWTAAAPEAINGALSGFSNTFGPVAAALAAIGLLAMALIEFGKEVLGHRGWWNRRWIRKWLTARISLNPTADFKIHDEPYEIHIDDVLDEIHKLATAGDENALYSQSVEKLVGQINAALQMALDSPKDFRAIIVTLAGNANPLDIRIVLGGRPEVARSERSEAMEDFVEARNRIASHFQRSLDGIMIAMNSQWKRRLHIWSVALSGMLIFLGAGVFREGSIRSLGDLILWLLVAIAGGLLAPMINDLAKTLRPAKGRG